LFAVGCFCAAVALEKYDFFSRQNNYLLRTAELAKSSTAASAIRLT